jgi:XTP/dITP diphosphohydrolase
LKGRDKIRIRPEVIVATQNRGKVIEIKKVIKGLGFQILSLNDFSGVPQLEEDGKSFLENALKKARFYSRYFGRLTLADDSGLEVDVLKGRPGVYSARYAGEGGSTQENNRKLLKEMEAIPLSKRGARFKCVLALVSPEGKEVVVEGSCRGRIGFKEVGKKGFGYDPLFVLPSYGKTMAQLSVEEKNRISHRGKALKKLRKIIEGLRN